MKNLFKQDRPKARRAYRVESLNPEAGISASMRVSDARNEYTVVLCLADKTTKTVFHSEASALNELHRYRSLYKQKKVR